MEKNTRSIYNLNIKKLRTLVIALFVLLTSFSTLLHVSKSATVLAEHIKGCDPTPPEQKISFGNFFVDNETFYIIQGTYENHPPNTPTAPTPSNEQTNVFINEYFSWTGGDPDAGDVVVYDVYFGTTNPPPKFASNHTATSFNPGLMNYTTQYYWKIIAWDNYNSSTPGPLWNFTTVPPGTNNPPNIPSIPTGPSMRLIGESGTYSTSAVDPDSDQVQYRFDWDAGGSHDYSGWTSLVPSGQSVNVSHSWSSTVTYLVCTQARDEHGSVSDWSTGLTVTVTGGTEILDQQSTRYDKSNTIFSSRWSAQSFKPSWGVLTKVKLYVGKAGSPSSDLVVSVRSSLNGADLTSVAKSSGSIPSGLSWVECDFPDISVNLSGIYYLVVRTSGGSATKNYLWGYGYYNPYLNGSFWMSTSSGLSWTEYAAYDFCFQTYSGDGGNSPPNVPAIPSGPVSRMVGESGTYSTSAVDPDSDQVQYRFDWDAGGSHDYSGWTSLVASGQSMSMSHSWSSAGTYLVRTQAKDEYGNEGSWSSSLTVTVTVSNSPPYVPSSPNPGNHATGVVVNADLSWTGGDPNGDIVTYDVYFGTTNPPPKFASNHTATSFNPGLMNYTTQYYWKIIAWDNYNSSTPGPLWNFTTVPPGTNNPPNQPTNPYPANGATDIDLNTALSWSGGDPDGGDTVTYDVYFGTTTSPGKVASNQSTLTYTPGTLQYITQYYWKIIAWDNHGHSRSGPLWGFVTLTSGGGGGGGGGGTTNKPPIADLSAGEPYQGIVGEPILFNGSRSHDPDGSITSWHWIFGDGHTGAGQTKTHVYNITGSFTASLTVTDNQGATNSDTTTVVITLPNRPPSQPTLDGPHNGTINTSSAYTAMSTDPENSTLVYKFDWGDGTTNTTAAEVSGTLVTMHHTWTYAGIYTLSVTASDGETSSAPATMTVLMGVEYVGDLGYLIDTNGDGIYDAFYSNATGLTTPVQRLADGTYLIDSDGSGTWDHLYNPETKELTLYTENISGGNGISKNGISNAVLLLAGILGAILVLFLTLLALTRTTRKQDQTPAEPVEKKSDSSNSTKRKPGKKTVNK